MKGRDVGVAAGETHDLIVVGGGIYGASLAMEAARRGLRPLLIERDDFGGATSWNSHRIIHGGLRYLQSLDLRRFRQSVSERSWFRRTFPELVEPLPCLMPLYGIGLKRPTTFRAALWLNDLLCRGRNRGVEARLHLPRGRVLGPAETRARFPDVDWTDLKGGGLWYDAVMRSSIRVLMELLRWACHCGATALNYVECLGLLTDRDRVAGVGAVDRVSGDSVDFRAPVVVNCAGPWSRALAGRLDREHEALFRPSLAFGVVLDRDPLSEAALAVTPRRPRARTYFLRPERDRIVAGTYHVACDRFPASPTPTEEQVDRLLADLNHAVPGLQATPEDIVRVYAGLLPAARPGSAETAARPIVLHHAGEGGPSGLWSISGVKYTTARLVAEHALRRVFEASGRDLRVRPGSERPPSAPPFFATEAPPQLAADGEGLRRALATLVEEEAVVYMDDLLMRRTEWTADPREAAAVAERVTRLLGRTLPSPA